MSKKVEVQKGPIRADMKTSKMMTHHEKLKEAQSEAAMRRSGQELKFHEPKSSRK